MITSKLERRKEATGNYQQGLVRSQVLKEESNLRHLTWKGQVIRGLLK